MTQKGSPQLGPLDFLHQDEAWQGRQDGDLVIMRLDEMGQRHLENVRAWLLANAARLHRMEVHALYGMASRVNGEMALDELDRAIGEAEEEDPGSWIKDQPLYQGITRRLTGRQ